MHAETSNLGTHQELGDFHPPSMEKSGTLGGDVHLIGLGMLVAYKPWLVAVLQ